VFAGRLVLGTFVLAILGLVNQQFLTISCQKMSEKVRK
jgi:hypothetical protein